VRAISYRGIPVAVESDGWCLTHGDVQKTRRAIMSGLGVGIIGAGTGRAQAPGFLQDPRVAHVALCDIDPEKLSATAEAVGITDTTRDWQEFIVRDDIQVVSVASPDHLHADMAVAALDAGKHVLCEKPMTMNLDEARRVIQAVERSGRKFLVNNVLRFYPRFQFVKQLVESGELGTIYAAEGDYIHNTLALIRNGWRGPHRHSVATGGGVHLIDLLRWLVGEVDEAMCYATYGVLAPDEAKSPDCMLAVLKFRNGAIAKSMTNMAAQRPAIHNLILYGTKGVFVNGKPDGLLYRGERSEPETVTATYGPPTPEAGHKTVGAKHLLDCIVYEGARSIAVCDAIYESFTTGSPAKVKPVE
jgi:predicted dehydrogenase